MKSAFGIASDGASYWGEESKSSSVAQIDTGKPKQAKKQEAGDAAKKDNSGLESMIL